jgi:hypothetical protein
MCMYGGVLLYKDEMKKRGEKRRVGPGFASSFVYTFDVRSPSHVVMRPFAGYYRTASPMWHTLALSREDAYQSNVSRWCCAMEVICHNGMERMIVV